MTTMNSALHMQSSYTEPGKQIVSSVVDRLNHGNVADAVDHFGGQFKFSDHALGLEFNDKARLEEFFHKTHELFPDAHLDVTAILESGNHVVAEWTLTVTHVELLWPGREARVQRSLPGVSIVAVTGGRISEWSDYYDGLTARRARLADFFTEWIEQ
jgi:diaminopimelate decarboxylase